MTDEPDEPRPAADAAPRGPRGFQPRLAAILALGALVVVLVMALVASALSSGSSRADTSRNRGNSLSITPKGGGGRLVGKPLPEAGIVTLDGEVTDLRTVTRGTPTLVNFFAESCTACVTEMPALQRLATATTGRLRVVGIDVQDSRSVTKAFLQRTGVRYTVLRDPQSLVLSSFGVTLLPTTVAVDAHGQIIGQRFGAFDKGELERWVTTTFGVTP